MKLYKKMEATVGASDGDTNFFGIVIGILQGDSLTSFLFIICRDYVRQTSVDLMKKMVSHF